ncbi:MAG: hypothetical protein AAF602_22095, partial [Myxococcota bacterium]
MIWCLLAVASAAEPEREFVGSKWEFGRNVVVAADEQARDVVVVGGDVEVEGEVLGNVIAVGGSIQLEGEGRVVGDTVVIGGRVRGTNVEGDKVSVAPTTDLTPSSEPLELARTVYRQLVWLLVVASAAVLVSGIFPGQVRRVAEHVESQPLRTGLVGLFSGGFVLLFSGMFATLTFGLGLPISVVLVAVLAAAWLLGIVSLAHAIGSRMELGQTAATQWVAVLIGVVAMGILTIIPVFGTLVFVAASALGLGAVMNT